MKVGDRVELMWNEPNATVDELNGVVLEIRSDGDILVRFDNGDEEGGYTESDFRIVESSQDPGMSP